MQNGRVVRTRVLISVKPEREHGEAVSLTVSPRRRVCERLPASR